MRERDQIPPGYASDILPRPRGVDRVELTVREPVRTESRRSEFASPSRRRPARRTAGTTRTPVTPTSFDVQPHSRPRFVPLPVRAQGMARSGARARHGTRPAFLARLRAASKIVGARRNVVYRQLEKDVLKSEGRGGGSFRCAKTVDSSLSRSNGRSPVRH